MDAPEGARSKPCSATTPRDTDATPAPGRVRPAGRIGAWRAATVLAVASILLLAVGLAASAQTDPLPSWNDGPAKQAIVKFVEAVTSQGGPQFVEPGDRIADFELDGEHGCEARHYVQWLFIF